jgi:hypothetical protein
MGEREDGSGKWRDGRGGAEERPGEEVHVDQDLAGADIRGGSVRVFVMVWGDDPRAARIFVASLFVPRVIAMEGSSSMESTPAETFRVTDAQRTKVYELTLQHAQVFGVFKDMATTASRGEDLRPVTILTCGTDGRRLSLMNPPRISSF